MVAQYSGVHEIGGPVLEDFTVQGNIIIPYILNNLSLGHSQFKISWIVICAVPGEYDDDKQQTSLQKITNYF